MAEKFSDKVLIIDDDSRNIFALKAVLRSKGFTCLTALSAGDGLKHLADHQDIGIVLLDMMMPEMDGYEAIGQIHDLKPSLPVVAVTAQAMVGDKEKCLEAGATGYVAKPINVDELMVLLNRFLK